MTASAGKPWLRRWELPLFLVILSILVAGAYGPSLRHGARADQFVYLLDTFEHEHFWDTLVHSYSWCRTRVLCPGDTHLFRPVFFALLAAEKALFGVNFKLWQAAAIALHLAACILLLLVFRRVQTLAEETEGSAALPARTPPGWLRFLPYAVVLFFALNYAIVEQVIWFHVNGYVLFVIFVLGSLLALLAAAQGGALSRRREVVLLSLAWLLCALAAFTYEVGQSYAVLAGCFVAFVQCRRQQRRRALLGLLAFAAIFVLYQGANRIDQQLHRPEFVSDVLFQEFWERIFTDQSWDHLGRYLTFVVVQPFFPLNCHSAMSPVGKLCQAEQVWNAELTQGGTLIFSLAVLVLWAVATLIGLCLLAIARRTTLLAVILFLCAIFGMHVAIIVLGRMNLRPGPTQLVLNPYYTYISLLFVLAASVPCLYGLAGITGRGFRTGRTVLVGMLLAGLTALGIGAGFRVHELNVHAADVFRGLRHWNHGLIRFVREHRHEADFCFALAAMQRSDEVPEQMGVPLPSFLYKRYLDYSQPKYVVRWEAGQLHALLAEQWQHEHGAERDSFCPDLVMVRRLHLVFHGADGYFAVAHGPPAQAFIYASDRRNYPGAIWGESLEELLQQVEPLERHRRADEKQHLRERLAR